MALDWLEDAAVALEETRRGARPARSSILLASRPDVGGDERMLRYQQPAGGVAAPVLGDRLRGELWKLSRHLLGLDPERAPFRAMLRAPKEAMPRRARLL
jgi:hypothetical protein